jgi:hypothetical protein
MASGRLMHFSPMTSPEKNIILYCTLTLIAVVNHHHHHRYHAQSQSSIIIIISRLLLFAHGLFEKAVGGALPPLSFSFLYYFGYGTCSRK